METRLQEIRSRGNKNIKIGFIPGHFATNHSHVNYYVDLTSIKTRRSLQSNTLLQPRLTPSFALREPKWWLLIWPKLCRSRVR